MFSNIRKRSLLFGLLAIPLLLSGTAQTQEPNPDELHAHREHLAKMQEELAYQSENLERHLQKLRQEMEGVERELREVAENRERVEREFHEVNEQLASRGARRPERERGEEPRGEMQELFGLVNDLRNEVRELRGQVQDLREGPGRRGFNRISQEETREALERRPPGAGGFGQGPFDRPDADIVPRDQREAMLRRILDQERIRDEVEAERDRPERAIEEQQERARDQAEQALERAERAREEAQERAERKRDEAIEREERARDEARENRERIREKAYDREQDEDRERARKDDDDEGDDDDEEDDDENENARERATVRSQLQPRADVTVKVVPELGQLILTDPEQEAEVERLLKVIRQIAAGEGRGKEATPENAEKIRLQQDMIRRMMERQGSIEQRGTTGGSISGPVEIRIREVPGSAPLRINAETLERLLEQEKQREESESARDREARETDAEKAERDETEEREVDE